MESNECAGAPENLEVFIVDPDEQSCEELRLITEACGYQVRVFNDGRPALQNLTRTEPRVLIVELLLPVMDGFELCQAVRSDLGYKDLPILCMTGISWGSVDLGDLLHRRFKAHFLAKGMLVEKYLATLQTMMQQPLPGEAETLPQAPENPPEESCPQAPVETSNLKEQAESVVRAVMSDKLDQGDSEDIIREQTDSVVKAVLEYRKRLEKVKPCGEYHFAKPVGQEAEESEEAPEPPVAGEEEEKPDEAGETGEEDSQVIGKMLTIRLGESGVRRTRDLTLEFQREVANVETSRQRRDVRVRKVFQVKVDDLEGLDAEYTDNISAGGLFIRTGKPPEKDTLITLSITLPNQERVVEAQARVIHAIQAEQAKVMGRYPGCGVEFVNLSADDRKFLEKMVQDEYTQPGQASVETDDGIQWIVLLGLPVLPMVGRPNFLLRNNIRMAEFPNLPAATGFLSGRRVALVIIGEAAFEGTRPEEFREQFAQLLPPHTQHLYLDPTQTMKNLLDEISRRLHLQHRASPRVPFQGPVAMHRTIDEVLAPEEFEARMINLSCSGMLLSSGLDLPIGTVLHLVFSLPNQLEIRCRALVVRRRQEENSAEQFYGVAFNEFFGDAEYQLEKFVQSQINFREFFRWMKKRYFEYP